MTNIKIFVSLWKILWTWLVNVLINEISLSYIVPEYTKLLNILNFLIGMFMQVYISHSKRAITISFLYNINPSKKIVR